MIRYSHVSLLILCESKASADSVTAHLGIQPSNVREDKIRGLNKEKDRLEDQISYAWVFDSPKSATDSDPTGRLSALADAIESFGERLLTLDPRFKRFVDIVYHITPQYPHGITGEFDWFHMPAVLMGRYAAWNLDVSYEAFWFNHPDWVRPAHQSLGRRFLRLFRRR